MYCNPAEVEIIDLENQFEEKGIILIIIVVDKITDEDKVTIDDLKDLLHGNDEENLYQTSAEKLPEVIDSILYKIRTQGYKV